MKSPKVKRINPTKLTSPEKTIVSGQTQNSTKQPVNTVVTSTSKQSISSQNSVKKIRTSGNKQQPMHVNVNPPIHSTQSLTITQIPEPNHLMERFHVKQFNLFYEGDISNGKFEGKGTLFQHENDVSKSYIYKGDWKNGSRDGYGHYIYPDGSEYSGQWIKNMKDGRGIYKNRVGDKYEGNWSRNLRHGLGTLTLVNGSILDGKWNQDIFISGKVKYGNQGVYEGQMNNYSREGPGSYTFQQPSQRYTGGYSNNQKQGKGTFNYNNGDSFIGSFANGKKSGKDGHYIQQGSKYELRNGQFLSDKAIHGSIYDKNSRKNVHTF